MAMDHKVKDFYEKYYSEVLAEGLTGRYQAYIHRFMESTLPTNHFKNILELGAGKLEHCRYTELDFESYLATDLQMPKVEKEVEIFSQKKGASRVFKTMYMDAENTRSLDPGRFDLLIATCLLIHLSNPYSALKDWRRLVNRNGFLVIYVPCDPGLLIRVLRQITNKRKYLKKGFRDYDLICSLEHLSSAHVLNNLIREVFKNDEIKIYRRPFSFINSWNFNLFYLYKIQLKSD